MKKGASKVAHNRRRPFYFTAHSPELIFHIVKSREQTSVLLSVGTLKLDFLEGDPTITVCINKIRKTQNKHMNIVCQNLSGL